MFTSKTATREFALKAAAAAERVMERSACCKSQFKFKCFSCGEFINRGDNITKCTAPCWDGMRLRFRGADARNGLTMAETAFYLAETGTRTWVHIGCNPCYWDSLPEDSNEYSPPALRPVHTDWNSQVWWEFEEMAEKYEGVRIMGISYYCMTKGYPWRNRKFMKDRIIHSVTRFQALWRGYLYKKAYPLALEQKRAEAANIWRGFLEWCGSLPHSTFRSFPRYCEVTGASAKVQACGRKKLLHLKLYPTIKKSSQSEPPLSGRRTLNYGPLPETLTEFAENIAVQRTHLRDGFLCDNPIGTQFDILMDAGFDGAAIYRAEVANYTKKELVDNGASHLYFWVRYHHDDEVRKYHWKRLLTLQLECENFKSKHGILCCGPTGKMPVALYK